MRFKSQQKQSEMPEVNLVPMMDVLMTILTFFIIIAMTLTTQQTVNVTLPSTSAGAIETKEPDPLIVGLNLQNQIILAEKPVSSDELGQKVQSYLTQNPKGVVILKADSKIPYEQVVKLLGTLRDMGGDRVSLAIEGN
ncbi:biopolymer transporter ExbD [Phormidesmis priestleyi ULC007]|uniref:Biopolymer transporter ExbD n=1 Tax=Phormidesmis priestleyi ULC007 TaxID=1920490 RepID=A0A2T1DN81_9CYAN|nr:biopolymer transporter ExbD [Phormidesmis priestleyi]PSB21874.1 biopolymer transporter ExbD [Phormidesmis priestleyi ULC007]PZO50530.1 MAG: biopolymer transporter ExbD [Phormidesmis priestleyi]